MYPVKIPTDTDEAHFGQGSGFLVPNRPHVYNTDLYTVLAEANDATTGHLEVWKSTDQGFTWAQQDATNEPTIQLAVPPTGGAIDTVNAFDITTTPILYAIYKDTTGKVRVKGYNVVQDRWQTTSAAGPTAPNTGVSATLWTVLGTRRPAGINNIDIPIAYQNGVENISGTDYERIALAGYHPATDTWDSSVRLFGDAAEAETYRLEAVADGPTTGVGQGRTHFFAVRGPWFNSTSDLVHRSLESNDTLNSIETVANGTRVVRNVGRPVGGTEIAVPVNVDFEDLTIFRADSSAAMTWSEELVWDGDPDIQEITGIGSAFGAARAANTYRVYFFMSPDPSLSAGSVVVRLQYSENTGGGWGVPVTVHEQTGEYFPFGGVCNPWGHENTDGSLAWPLGFNRRTQTASPSDPQGWYTQEGTLEPSMGMKNGIFDAPEGFVIA